MVCRQSFSVSSPRSTFLVYALCKGSIYPVPYRVGTDHALGWLFLLALCQRHVVCTPVGIYSGQARCLCCQTARPSFLGGQA